MINKARLSHYLFRLVCLSFSVLLLILSLMAYAGILSTQNLCHAVEEEIEQLLLETEILKVSLDNRISLYELETVALNELGMQRPGIEQMYFNMLPG